uniref:Uncharacterized protein n=1 Tax=Pyxicephalus adspersus TaxID=30357 RepID=A0AAV3B4E3_PYXAD|nr:TPA: hypothetical protein GDO54_006434 [Pyxicephalus adspersus]
MSSYIKTKDPLIGVLCFKFKGDFCFKHCPLLSQSFSFRNRCATTVVLYPSRHTNIPLYTCIGTVSNPAKNQMLLEGRGRLLCVLARTSCMTLGSQWDTPLIL